MRRREALAVLALAPAFARAAATPRVALLAQSPSGQDGWRKRFAAEGLRDGENVSLEFFGWGVGEEYLLKVVASGPDAILIPGGPHIAFFKKATTRIPIVFWSFGGDPVEMGYVQSLRRPGGNVTGTTNHAIAVMEKGWEVMKEMRPKARRMGALFDTDFVKEAWYPSTRDSQLAAAARLKLERVEIVVPPDAGAANAWRAVRDAHVDTLDVAGGNWDWAWDFNEYLIQAAIPAYWELPVHVKKGGLFSLIGSMDEAMAEAVRMVALILRGADPATMPVYDVRRMELTLNLATARRMKLEIPKAVLLRADALVE